MNANAQDRRFWSRRSPRVAIVAALRQALATSTCCTLCCVYLMATFGLNLTVGYAGQMSLGQAAFFGIGALHRGDRAEGRRAVSAGRAADRGRRVLRRRAGARAFPALRVQHHYLAFATLGFNVLVFLIMRNEEKITGGTFGISGIPRPSLFGLSMRQAVCRSSTSRFVSLIVLAFAAVVAAALAVGTRVRGAARQPDPRGEPGRQHHRVHAARVRDRRRVRRHRRRLLRVAGASSSSPGRSTSRRRCMMLLAVIVGGSGRFFGPGDRHRSSSSCCPSSCAPATWKR